MSSSCRHPNARAAVLSAVLCLMAAMTLNAEISASARYRSPRNPERKVRTSTELIVLHTTEAPAKSSLNKVSDRGECHYVVTEEGAIYTIIDRDREAFHAGRSMWKGKEDVDKFSVGIECVGKHNEPMGMVQLRAIASLVSELKRMYRISDENVVCHSHVAYGPPNKWHKVKHRGRKRCAMLFATPSVRRVLGLSVRPRVDFDVRAKRLIVADKYLNSVLYGSLDPMAKHYPKPKPIVAAAQRKPPPSKTAAPLKPAAAQPRPVASAVPQKKPATSAPVPPRAAPVPPRAAPAVVPAPRVAPAPVLPPKTEKELGERGWKVKGTVEKGITVSRIAGKDWNSPDTYYTLRGKVMSGASIDPGRVQAGTKVWMKK